MNDDQKQTPPRLTRAQIAQCVLGIMIFALLMGIRQDLPSLWMRVLAAACAGAAFAILVILPLRKR